MESKRRVSVILSSSFQDLEQHRKAILEAMSGSLLTPLTLEPDNVWAASDLIEASLDKVDAADVYVGVIGSRYGQRPESPVRNPDGLSLTELEYRRAVERKLPRLMFIMSDDHELTLADLRLSQTEGEEARKRQQAFTFLVRKDRIAAEFSSPADLKAKAATSFVALQKSLEDVGSGHTSNISLPLDPNDGPPPAPPTFYSVRKPYIEIQGFVGRAEELALIDQWAAGADTMLLLQAIGGMGKSMLSWHWLRERATMARGDWAGQLWYSFYEHGADLNDFCAHALAYVRHKSPKTFRGRRTIHLGAELRRELDARPWLLVLDGLERILVAYNRSGTKHIPDVGIVDSHNQRGPDHGPRDCFYDGDDAVLVMLAQPGKGKLLVSSRLTPAALTNAVGLPIPGVAQLALGGLAPEDAEQVLRNAGVRGSSERMRHYLDDGFAGHPLSVAIVAKQVTASPETRGDFDRWVRSPKGGGDPKLTVKDLRGRQNYVLAQMLDGLDDDTKALLARVAAANIELTPDVLRFLNPKRPIIPTKVDRPRELGDADYESHDHWSLKFDRDYAETDHQRVAAQTKLDAYRRKYFDKQRKRYDSYVSSYLEWQEKANQADAWLDQALPVLAARGLVQFDAETGAIHMHRAIRQTVLSGLSPDARIGNRQPKVFLSATHSDGSVVTRVAAALLETGVNVWLDIWKLAPGDSILERIDQAVQSNDFVLVFLSKASVASRWIRNEIDSDFSREMKDRAIAIIPVVVEDCDIPLSLADQAYLDLRGDFAAAVQQLARQLAAAPAIDLSRLVHEKFEQLIRELLPPLGFALEDTRDGHDDGIDLLAMRTGRDEFGAERSEKWLVVVKSYRRQRVGITTITELMAVLADAPPDMNGLLITDSHLTSVARDFLSDAALRAKRRVRVIDGAELTNLLLHRPELVARYFIPSNKQ